LRDVRNAAPYYLEILRIARQFYHYIIQGIYPKLYTIKST